MSVVEQGRSAGPADGAGSRRLAEFVAAVGGAVLELGLPARSVTVALDGVRVSLPYNDGAAGADAAQAAGLVAWAGALGDPVFEVARADHGWFLVIVQGRFGGVPWEVTGQLHRSRLRGVPRARYERAPMDVAVVAQLAAGRPGAVVGDGAAA